MCRGIGLRETTKVGKLRRSKSGRGSRLEGTSEKQLRGKKGGEVHIEGPGGGHIGGGVARRGGGIEGNIGATRMAVRKVLVWSGVIRAVCLVGETSGVCV